MMRERICTTLRSTANYLTILYEHTLTKAVLNFSQEDRVYGVRCMVYGVLGRVLNA